MKYLPFYLDDINCKNSDEVFTYFENTINSSITLWNYFVNWGKVLGNVKDIEADLNTLNYLIGKENVREEFEFLLRRNPTILKTIPILIASRESGFKILIEFNEGNLKYEDYRFGSKSKLNEDEILAASKFAEECGVLELFGNKTIKSIVDYVIGVEVGLDTNGRKNRGGTQMETLLEGMLNPICLRNGWKYMPQATAKKIKAEWGLAVEVDKSSRKFDFAINKGGSLFLIETNYYGGGGSKLKSTAGEYKALYDFIDTQGHRFVWVTDGMGWKTALRPLRETFDYIDWILNLEMICKGLLEKILTNTD
jgi:type II restriction enzyme